MANPLSIEVKFPKLFTETSPIRVQSSSPTKVSLTGKKPLNLKSPQVNALQKQKKVLMESLASRFFLDESPPPQPATNFSTPKPSKLKSAKGLWKREFEKVNQNLINNELNIAKAKGSNDSLSILQQEFIIYKEYLEGLAGCYSEKYIDISKSIIKATANTAKVFSKLIIKINTLEVTEALRKAEKSSHPKEKNYCERFCQTEESKLDCPEVDIQNLKCLSEKLKNINMPRVTRRLAELQRTLVQMNTPVPETPKTPDIDHANFIQILKNALKPQPGPEKSSINTQTDPLPPAITTIEFNSDESLQAELYYVKKMYEEQMACKPSAEKTEEKHEVMIMDNDKKLKDVELELMQFKNKYRLLEMENLRNISKMSIRQKRGSVEKKAEDILGGKEELEEMKKKFSEQNLKMKGYINELEAKLMEIEEAWMKKTGKAFVYGTNVVTASIINSLRKDSSKPEGQSSNFNIDFMEPGRKNPKFRQKGAENPNPKLQNTGNDAQNSKLNPNPQNDTQNPSGIVEILEVASKAQLSMIDIDPKITEYSEDSNSPIERVLKGKDPIALRKAFNSPLKQKPLSPEKTYATKETEESIMPTCSVEIYDTQLDEIEERLYKALNEDQWSIFLEYKALFAVFQMKKAWKNVQGNSKECSIPLDKSIKFKPQNHKNSKSLEYKNISNSIDTLKVTSELQSYINDPLLLPFLSKAIGNESIDNFTIGMKLELLKILNEHKYKRCAEECEHLKRAMTLRAKVKGKPYPVKNVVIF
ncbi:hypothetical protein SteCoe_13972 [Stentor coeruleus]|uniref:Uncharacterized protein n=1 Tax=Stentor coeruleus TaxID=5963 RepID=A0A1R2C760_9CILI|nr:hypothetical protein SteCoe_13972 [Stentor coeruleus]